MLHTAEQGDDEAPIEIIITDDVVLSNIPKTARSSSCDCSLSISTSPQDFDELDSSIPQYIEMTPGNYYEIVESRWESEHNSGFGVGAGGRIILDGSDKSPKCVSDAPGPIDSCTTISNDLLGYGTPLEGNNNNRDNMMGRPGRRRGSLVMTLKKTSMHQEDTTRRERVVSPVKPTIPFRRGSLILSFEDNPQPHHHQQQQLQQTASPPLLRASSEHAPIRPFRRASIVMNVALSPEEANKNPKRPFRRGSLICSIEDMEYGPTEPAQRVQSSSSAPPKYPSRKASMDMMMCISMESPDDDDDDDDDDSHTFADLSQTKQEEEVNEKRRGSLVWTVTPSHGSGGTENEAERICLTVSGFSVQQGQDDSPGNDGPRFPHRLQSMDMASGSCA